MLAYNAHGKEETGVKVQMPDGARGKGGERKVELDRRSSLHDYKEARIPNTDAPDEISYSWILDQRAGKTRGSRPVGADRRWTQQGIRICLL